MPVRLIPIASGKQIKLDKPVVLIGRNPDCDIILTRSRKVSRAHCVVACVENSVVVRDLGSTNGVWINGHRVERESSLRLGDELSIADVRYQLLNVERGKNKGSSGEMHAQQEPLNNRSDKNHQEPPAPHVISVNEKIDKNHENRLRRSVVKPINMSQNVPVAIPEEDDSFVVENSMPRLPKPSALAELEAVERRASRSKKRPADDSSCDVIPLPNQSPPTDESIPAADSPSVIPLAEHGMSARPMLDTGISLNSSPDSDAVIPLDTPDA